MPGGQEINSAVSCLRLSVGKVQMELIGHVAEEPLLQVPECIITARSGTSLTPSLYFCGFKTDSINPSSLYTISI